MARKQAALVVFSLAMATLACPAQEPRPPLDPLAPVPADSPKPDQPDRERGRDRVKGEERGKADDRGKGDERGKGDDRERKHRSGFTGPDAEKAREAFHNMSPEERERWTKRIREWAEMPPEKKKSLADREEFFRRKVREDIDAAIQKTGLALNEEQKKLFSDRYMEERRKIETELRKEMDEKRGPRVDAMIESLKTEFSAPVAVKPDGADKP